MQIRLSDHFTYRKILRFTFPSVVMMIFTSIYGVVDGLFVSNFVGKIPFAAVNFIMPLLMILGCIGFVFGTGGSALVAKTLGEGEEDKANRYFSLFVYASAIIGIVIAISGIVFLRPIAAAMGAKGQMLSDCVTYGRVILAALPAYILQMEFQSFFITAERPKLGLFVTVCSGVANMVLDALFVAVFPMGLVGAALATALSQVIGGIVPVLYFLRPNDSLLRLTKTRYYGSAMLKAVTNGSSELMSNISMSLVSMLYNMQLIQYAGENGVAAYGVLMYVNMIFLAVFIGLTIGTAPVISYHYGAENHGELKSLLKKGVVLITAFAVGMLLLSYIMATPLCKIFVGYDSGLYELTHRGFLIFALSFPFAGYAIFGSGFFTALNDGLTSALISFLRTLVFQIAAILLLPIFWGIDGIWYSIVVAEVMAASISWLFILLKRKKYHYM